MKTIELKIERKDMEDHGPYFLCKFMLSRIVGHVAYESLHKQIQ